MIVADANLIAYLILESEFTALADAVYQKDSQWIAPVLWRSEFRNILVAYVRQELITVAGAKLAMASAENNMADAKQVNSDAVINASVTFNLSAYDAEYYVTSKFYGVTLVTHDQKLLKNCSEAVSMEDFIIE